MTKSYIRSSSLANHQPEIIDVVLKITAAKTVNIVSLGLEAITGFDNTDFTQAAADALLGTADIVAVTTAFGTTRMDTDCFGIILGLQGQVRELIAVEVITQLATGASVVMSQMPVRPYVELVDAAPDLAEFTMTPLGNVYGSIVVSGMDIVTSGLIHLRIICRLK